MSPTTQVRTIEVNIAADTEEEREVIVGLPGTWKLQKAYIIPATTAGANGTNYVSVDLLKGTGGATMLTAALSTAATALTKGTVREFSIVPDAAAEIDGLTGSVEVDINMPGTGAAIDGMLAFVFEKVR